MPAAQPLGAFRRSIDVWLDASTSVDARREVFVAYARERFDEFDAAWAQELGATPETETFVDGVKGARLEAVKIPGGSLARRVQPIAPIVDRLLEIIDTLTKVVTGDYKSKNAVYLNDGRVPAASVEPKPGDEVAVVNLSDFSRKAEVRAFNDRDDSGFSSGLFESAAAILRKEFRGSLVPIRFTFREFLGRRLPTVVIG